MRLTSTYPSSWDSHPLYQGSEPNNSMIGWLLYLNFAKDSLLQGACEDLNLLEVGFNGRTPGDRDDRRAADRGVGDLGEELVAT